MRPYLLVVGPPRKGDPTPPSAHGGIGIYSDYEQRESEEEDRYQKYENTKTREEKGKPSEYLGSRNNNLTQGSSGLVQSLQHGQDPGIKTLPLHALSMIVE